MLPPPRVRDDQLADLVTNPVSHGIASSVEDNTVAVQTLAANITKPCSGPIRCDRTSRFIGSKIMVDTTQCNHPRRVEAKFALLQLLFHNLNPLQTPKVDRKVDQTAFDYGKDLDVSFGAHVENRR